MGAAVMPATANQYGPIGIGTPYANITPTDPNNPLSNQTILSQPSAQTQQYGQQLAGDITGLQNAPDQAALEQQMFGALANQSNPIYQQNLRSVGQSAAKFGRIGSGLTTSALGDVASNYNQYLGNIAAQLAATGAQQQYNNQATTAGLTQNALGQSQGNDQTQYGNLIGQQYYQGQQGQQAFNNNLNQAGAYGALANSYGNPGGGIQDIANQYGQQGAGNLGAGGNLLGLILQNGGIPGLGAGGVGAVPGAPPQYNY